MCARLSLGVTLALLLPTFLILSVAICISMLVSVLVALTSLLMRVMLRFMAAPRLVLLLYIRRVLVASDLLHRARLGLVVVTSFACLACALDHGARLCGVERCHLDALLGARDLYRRPVLDLSVVRVSACRASDLSSCLRSSPPARSFLSVACHPV